MRNRAILRRQQSAGVKLVTRPSGATTAKAEIDHVAQNGVDHAGRMAHKRLSEDAALEKKKTND